MGGWYAGDFWDSLDLTQESHWKGWKPGETKKSWRAQGGYPESQFFSGKKFFQRNENKWSF